MAIGLLIAAIKLGAKSIICESIPSDIQNGVTYLEVELLQRSSFCCFFKLL